MVKYLSYTYQCGLCDAVNPMSTHKGAMVIADTVWESNSGVCLSQNIKMFICDECFSRMVDNTVEGVDRSGSPFYAVCRPWIVD